MRASIKFCLFCQQGSDSNENQRTIAAVVAKEESKGTELNRYTIDNQIEISNFVAVAEMLVTRDMLKVSCINFILFISYQFQFLFKLFTYQFDIYHLLHTYYYYQSDI